jgi:hypothetical protein
MEIIPNNFVFYELFNTYNGTPRHIGLWINMVWLPLVTATTTYKYMLQLLGINKRKDMHGILELEMREVGEMLLSETMGIELGHERFPRHSMTRKIVRRAPLNSQK